MRALLLSIVLGLGGCTTQPPVWSAASEPGTIEAQVHRLTKKTECLCTIEFDHALGGTYSTTTIKFQVDAPKEYAGRVVALRFSEAPAVCDAFEEILSNESFVLRLRKNDLLGIDEEEVTWADGTIHKQTPQPYIYSEILVRVLDEPKKSANQPLQGTPGKVPPPATEPGARRP